MEKFASSRLSAGFPDIECDEVGTPNPSYWKGQVSEVAADYEAIRSLSRRKVIGLVEHAGNLEIHGRDRVGVIHLPSGRRILLRTKIQGIVVLDWLVYLREFPDLRLWTSGGNVSEGGAWQTVLARLFLNELDLLTRLHLRKGVVSFRCESPTVRGRIQSHRLAQQPWRLPLIPQVVRGRSLNTPANRMLASALDEVSQFLPELSPTETDVFRRLRNDWAEISRIGADRQSVINASQAVPPEGYGQATQLARLILRGAAIDPMSGSGGHTFTISLARIWENAVTQICFELQSATNWRVASRSHCVRPWDDAKNSDDQYRSMIADTLLTQGRERWVLDAKYKRAFGTEDRNDRFQMCAYALGFHAKRATLVYPTTNRQTNTHRVLLDTVYGGQQFIVDAVAFDMEEGPEHCKRRLLEHFTSG